MWDLKTYKFKTDLPGHADEVYCLDFVANKVVSGGRVWTVKMCMFSFFCSSCMELISFKCVDGRIEGLRQINLYVYLVAYG